MKEQRDLPTMEDRALADLEDAAKRYAKLRDKRMAIGVQEVALKVEIKALLKKHKKTSYNHDGVEIELVVVDEKVKVRIRDEEEGAEEKE